MVRTRKEGIFENINIEDYHSDDGISNSGINLILDCPKRYWNEYINPLNQKDSEKSRSLLIGSALHYLSLEPELFDSTFIISPKVDRRTTKGKEEWNNFQSYVHSLKNKLTIMSEEIYLIAKQMAISLNENKAFQAIKKMGGKIENSLYWYDDNGVLLRSRPDFFNDEIILDIKTTKSLNEFSFKRAIGEYGYHRQAALAEDGLTKLSGISNRDFVIIAIENKEPYLTKSFRLRSDSLSIGREEYKKGSEIYKSCLQSGIWPGYDDRIQDISLTDWYIQKGI
jgi:exodeoxyribonuclease VIII